MPARGGVVAVGTGGHAAFAVGSGIARAKRVHVAVVTPENAVRRSAFALPNYPSNGIASPGNIAISAKGEIAIGLPSYGPPVRKAKCRVATTSNGNKPWKVSTLGLGAVRGISTAGKGGSLLALCRPNGYQPKSAARVRELTSGSWRAVTPPNGARWGSSEIDTSTHGPLQVAWKQAGAVNLAMRGSEGLWRELGRVASTDREQFGFRVGAIEGAIRNGNRMVTIDSTTGVEDVLAPVSSGGLARVPLPPSSGGSGSTVPVLADDGHISIARTGQECDARGVCLQNLGLHSGPPGGPWQTTLLGTPRKSMYGVTHILTQPGSGRQIAVASLAADQGGVRLARREPNAAWGAAALSGDVVQNYLALYGGVLAGDEAVVLGRRNGKIVALEYALAIP